MDIFSYRPPFLIANGLLMTLYAAFWLGDRWESTIDRPEPDFQEQIFTGAQGVPLFGLVAIPKKPRGTVIATYGITGDLENQWILSIFARKAYAQGYAVVLFDWRAHGRSIELSPTLTSDGLYEGEDFVRIAAQVHKLGCPPKFWFVGYSLGGQLALWGIKTAQELVQDNNFALQDDDIGGGIVLCPNLDANRSLNYLVKHPIYKYLEKAIAQKLHQLACKIQSIHPGTIDPLALNRANSIWGFDRELVISKLGFASVEEYYDATSPLHFLPNITKPTLIIYAANDPFFHPAIIPELEAICAENYCLDLLLTEGGGHVVHFNSNFGKRISKDPDPWWAWNRTLEWLEKHN